jgi:pimeloyl-ACP methyl ester carboxylesterase
MLRQGTGEPLVLFHGILGSERMWAHVVPRLAPHHDTVALTALGHRTGNPVRERPASITHVVDDAERLLDSLGFETAHLAGNSMGGWIAVELARRGRARSVCALSPGGFWRTRPLNSSGSSDRTVSVLRRIMKDTRRGRPLLPLLGFSRRFRRWAMAGNAVNGDRLTRNEFISSADDVLGCRIAGDLLSSGESIGAFESLPCPITIAWSAHDRVLPLRTAGALAREEMPDARFLILDAVGHVPMFDDPDLVARTILETTRSATGTGLSSVRVA